MSRAIELTPRLLAAIEKIDEYMSAHLDEYEGAPRKFGENEGKRRYYEFLAALGEVGVNL